MLQSTTFDECLCAAYLHPNCIRDKRTKWWYINSVSAITKPVRPNRRATNRTPKNRMQIRQRDISYSLLLSSPFDPFSCCVRVRFSCANVRSQNVVAPSTLSLIARIILAKFRSHAFWSLLSVAVVGHVVVRSSALHTNEEHSLSAVCVCVSVTDWMHNVLYRRVMHRANWAAARSARFAVLRLRPVLK